MCAEPGDSRTWPRRLSRSFMPAGRCTSEDHKECVQRVFRLFNSRLGRCFFPCKGVLSKKGIGERTSCLTLTPLSSSVLSQENGLSPAPGPTAVRSSPAQTSWPATTARTRGRRSSAARSATSASCAATT